MTDLAVWRVNLLRAGYLLLLVGLGLTVWPSVVNLEKTWTPDRGVIIAMLASLSLLALVGLRHPLRMLPLLFWEMTWKVVWLVRIALPLWIGNGLDAVATQTAIECVMAVLIGLVVPWGYVSRHYIRGAGERWRRKALSRTRQEIWAECRSG